MNKLQLILPMTVTLKPHIAVLPAASDVLHVTSVSPTSKKSPEFTSTVPNIGFNPASGTDDTIDNVRGIHHPVCCTSIGTHAHIDSNVDWTRYIWRIIICSKRKEQNPQ